MNKSIFTYNDKEYHVEDIIDALKQSGIKNGDSIFVHSDLKSFGKLNNKITRQEFLESFIEALKKTVGEHGNIIMPTFSYSFCKNEIFDPETTPSTVGILTEYFRKLKEVKRSIDPIFSVSALGPDKDYFTDVGTNCFGDKSIFMKLYDKNAKIVFLGETFDITYMHFVEQKCGVLYRFIKKFKGEIKCGNKLEEFVFDYNVRPLDKDVNYDLEGIADFLESKGVLKKAELGNSKIRVVNAVDTFNELEKGFENNIYLLLKKKHNLNNDEYSTSEAGKDMHKLIKKLFPICRSITGNGVRETLTIIQEYVPIKIIEVSSGTKVFDWTVPKEWNIKDAYVKNSKGEKIIDFKESNLHVLNYSIPVNKKMPLEELKTNLYTLPDYPDWIPYLTSYYKDNWGFCLTHKQYEKLEEDTFEVVIDSTLEEGKLTFGELYLKGKIDDEVLISCYICHPSLCNDNLSGTVLLTFLSKLLLDHDLKYSYRFLFIPETIGAITWLSLNEDKIQNIKHGLVATCVGDPGILTYKKTRDGDTIIDKVVQKVMVDSGDKYNIVDFFPSGSDERQFSSPGFNLPMGSLMRTMYGCFPEYHTSADNLDFVKPAYLADSLEKYLKIIFILENNTTYLNLNLKCEPQLGKRGLYRMIGSQKTGGLNETAILWVLNQSDGTKSLLDIAIRSNLTFQQVKDAADALYTNGLLKIIDDA